MEDDESDEDEDVRLGIAISLSIMTDGDRDERKGRAKRRATAGAARVQAAPAATTAAGAAGCSTSKLFTGPDDLFVCEDCAWACHAASLAWRDRGQTAHSWDLGGGSGLGLNGLLAARAL